MKRQSSAYRDNGNNLFVACGPDSSSWCRTIISCLIISLMILGPLAPLAPSARAASARPANAPTSSAPKSKAPKVNQPAANTNTITTLPPVGPVISATKVDSFPDPDADGKAAPGETITYDVNITNNGSDASGVNFTDTIDANTTLVVGSLKVSPLAFADTFSAAKNTPLSVGAPGVLTNDTGVPAPTAVAIAGGATAQGGTVTLNTDGSFLYTPASGFTGADTFNYTVTNGLTPNDTAQVTINVDAPPSVTATTPTNGATNQALNTNITVTFSEPVNVTGNWFQIVCTSSGTRNVADTVVTGGPTTFTINPNVDFGQNETCTTTVFAAQVTDQDSNDPPDNMSADFVFSFTTQDAAPSVTSTTPTNGATNQNTNTDITVTFSEPVNVTGNWFQIVCGTSGTRNVADTVVTGGPTTFTINPNADFASAETCTVTVFAAQVTDQDTDDPPDNMAANFVFSFTTEAAPSVTSTVPTNGATGITSNTNVTITFSEPVNVTGNWFQLVGASSGTRNVADTVVTGGPTTFTINPNVDFAPGELVTVTIFAAQVTDQDTNDPPDNMAANFVFSFTIDQAPSVTATTPTNGATNVAVNSNLSITFSEPVNVTGNWFQIVCPTTGTRNVADTVVTGGPTTFTINPNADFTFNETCTVTVFAAQVTDQDSADPPDNMVANFVFSFTTVDAAPTVTATTPTNGATNQASNTNINVTFSEPVNVTGNWFQIVCTTSGTRNVADTVVTGGPTTFTINPNTDFTQAETCTVTIIAAQVTDQDTNDPPDNMAANFVFSFSIDAAPSVTATTPTNGATQQANNTNLSITFSEPVNVTGNWFQIVGATSGTRNVADTVVTGGPTTFTINPNTDFANGELVTVTVFAAQVTDQDSADPPDNMTANFVFSFTIDQAPSVTTTVPTNGAINVLKTANIIINFSEAVTATTSSFTIECPAPGNLQAFTVSGSGTNQITLDPVGTLPQGQICTVTVIANQISDTDTGDPPDNMVANFVFSFGVQPEAFDDARNATGNIQIQTAGRSNFSVLTNDIGPGIAVTAFDATSARGGNVSVAANGTFTYNPPAGYEGPDSFNYTITNPAGSDVGTVNITVSGMIWFIDDNAASGSCTTNNNICGRLTNPFSTLPSFEAVNGNATPTNGADVIAPEAGDHIFIFSGTFTGPLTLENNQRVIGQGATTGTLSALSGITPATDSDALPATGGTKPSIVGGGFNVVSNNQLYGLQFDDSTSTSINSTANIGTMVFGDITVLNDGSASSGIILDDGGSVTNVGTNLITTTTGTALNLTNTTIGAGGLTFRTITAGTGASGPARAIILNNPGSGPLTITGDGSTANSGGTIQHTTGAAGANPTGTGAIDITGGSGTYTFRFMRIFAPGGNGVMIFNSPSNIVLEKSTIDHNNAVVSNSFSVRQENHSGTSTLTFDGLLVQNKADGTTAVSVSQQDTASMTLNVQDSNTGDSFNSTFQNLFGSGIVFGAGDNSGANGTATVNVSNAKFLTPAANGINDLEMTVQQNSVLNFNVHDNVFDRATVGANALVGVINVNATGSGRIGSPGNEAVIQNNTIQNLGSSNALLGYQGIRVAPDNCSPTGATPCTVSPVTHRLRIQGNTITNTWQSAVNISARGRANLNLTFLNNIVGTLANPVGKSNRRGVLMETQASSNLIVSITGNTIVGAGSSNSNAALALRAGADNSEGNADGTINTTMSGNTIKNSNASTTGWFRAETVNLGVGVSAGNMCLDYNNNTLRNGADAADATKTFDLLHNSTGTFTRRNGGGNTGTETTTGVIGANSGCTQPSFALNQSPFEKTDSHIAARTPNSAAPAIVPNSDRNERVLSHHAQITRREVANSNAAVKRVAISNAVSTKAVANKVVTVKSATTPSVNHSRNRLQLTAQQSKKPRHGISVKPAVAPLAAETVTTSIGTLLAGKTVHIQFQVTVNNPYLGGATVSNQGTVSGSNFSDVLTDDPAVGGANDPTQTPILLLPNISVADAQANEPASGSTPMLFTISLSAPAGASGASVHYATADQAPGVGHAVAGVDYTAVPDTVLNFATGEQFKTVSVDILSDGAGPEPDETFLLNLSNPTNANIADGQAVGTIKQGNAAGTLLISELRTSGPAGAGDDFVELYNNTDTPLTIAASDASGGYGLFKMGATCGDTPVLIGVVPNGTVIPARGHYLFVGSAYSLANYGGTAAAAGNQTLSADIENDRNVAIFTTASVANLSSVTRLDAVGFGANTGANCDLLREGTTLTPMAGSVLEYSYQRDLCGKKGNPAMFGPCPTGGLVADTNDNANDFIVADTTGAVTPAGQRLGAPGPENLASPLLRGDALISTLLLDANIGAPAAPNRVRDLTPVTNGANGTLSVRRRFVNNTGAPVTRLRFRIVDFSSLAVPGGIADLRALTSTNVTVNGVTDSATCLAANGVATTPCTVTVLGTTLEQPPTQSIGGALNSTMSAGTITLGTPLAPGASINLQFLLGVQQSGSFKFFFNVEALP